MAGCSYSPNAVQVEIDSTFSADKRQMILSALDEWSSKTNGGFGVSTISYPVGISTDTEFNVIKFVNQNRTADDIPNSTMGELGLAWSEYVSVGHLETHVQATIYTWDGTDNTLFPTVVKHEIGHSLDVNHYCSEALAKLPWTNCYWVASDPEPSIMYPDTNTSSTIVEPIDVFRFCSKWGCPQ